jgi:DNA-binding SARP family transcriptional activator
MRRLTRAFVAAVWLTLFGIGLPAALVAWAGWPFPERMPTGQEWSDWLEQPLTRPFLTGVLAVLLWTLWGLFVFAVVLELLNRLTRLRLGRLLRLVSPVRALTTSLVGGLVTAPAVAAPTVAVYASPAPSGLAVDSTTSGPTVWTPARLVEPAAQLSPLDHGAAGSGPVHRVSKGDTLWHIARVELGDPSRWPEIYRLNRGKIQSNGYQLRDPDEIHIGWLLDLPERQPTASTPSDPRQRDPAPEEPVLPAAPPTSGPGSSAPTSMPSANTAVPTSTAEAGSSSPPTTAQAPHETDQGHGVTLPSRGWVSLGLAATIAAVAALLRLQRRRRTRVAFPIPLRTGPVPVPDSLRRADAAGSRTLATRSSGPLPDLAPETPSVPAPIGVDERGDEISLFALPGRAVALDGAGTPGAARAVVAAVLATGVTDHASTQPVLVIAAETLAWLLPDGVAPHGLDPRHETFDGERLIVVADVGAAVTHLETEMIHRRRLLDAMGADSADELNARTDHAEHLAPYVLLAPADPRYAARILAVAAHRHPLHLHPVILGALHEVPEVANLHIAAGGAFTTSARDVPLDRPVPRDGRLAVLAADDLADVLGMVAAVAPRPETGDERTDPEPGSPPQEVDLTEVPAPTDGAVAPVRLTVLGPPALATADGPIGVGVRRGSLAVLAVLAVHPRGRTFEEIAADLHPDATDRETGVNRVRTDLNAVRSLLRATTGIEGKGRFIVHDTASGRYRIDPELIEVDLWRMLSAIDRANKAGDDEAVCLAALREAVGCYGGDFAEGHDRAWITDYATTYRHQLLSVYARIAELLETDQPDQAIAALEAAIERDPVNEELYQRLMRIQGRLGRADAVRRTLRLLEDRLAELGEAEPSETTRRVAARQLQSTLGSRA